MASNRGLNQQEILDKLFTDDHDEHEKHVVPGIGVDAQSDAEEGDTEYEEDSEDEDQADLSDPLQHLSSGLAPEAVPRLSNLPRGQPAGSTTAPRLSDLTHRSSEVAGSSGGITGSPARSRDPHTPFDQHLTFSLICKH